MATYRLVNYFDVWGNAAEGWEVNNLCSEGQVEIDNIDNDEEILKVLIDSDFLVDTCTSDKIRIEGDADMIEISEAKNGRPICRLELEKL